MNPKSSPWRVASHVLSEQIKEKTTSLEEGRIRLDNTFDTKQIAIRRIAFQIFDCTKPLFQPPFSVKITP